MLVSSLKHLVANLQPAPPARPQPLPCAAEPKDWTVLVYLDGRQGQAAASQEALQKLQRVGSSAHLNVVVQATQQPTWREMTGPDMSSLPTRRYLVGKGQSQLVQELPGQLPLDQQSMADFVSWGMQSFPARHTMLMVKEAGGEAAPLSGVQLAAALEQAGKKLDVVAFDTGSMEQMEVAYQLRHQAQVMTGAPEEVKARAYPYDQILRSLTARAEKATPQEVGRMVVGAHTGQFSIHDAADLTRLEEASRSVRSLVDRVLEARVPKDLLYTSMTSAIPMERRSLGPGFDRRDLGTFLESVGDDPRYPEPVRQAAKHADGAVKACVLAQYASPVRLDIKHPTGFTSYMPWRAPDAQQRESYARLDYARDSGWGELLDYVLKDAPPAGAPVVPSGKGLGLAQQLGKWSLFQYKKYVSPYLESHCNYTPSCSQYAREAIETQGLWEGSKLGFLRVLSCDGSNRGPDPVPGHVDGPKIREDLLVAPPLRLDKSPTRLKLESGLTRAAAKAGWLLGGAALATLAMPFGVALGGFIGWKAGTHSIDAMTAGMLHRYGPAKTEGYLNLARPVGQAGFKTHQAIEGWTGSQALASAVGGAVGAVSGAALGLAGAAAKGFVWGSAFGRLWGQNRTREAFGELPVQPQNEAILRQDYAGQAP